MIRKLWWVPGIQPGSSHHNDKVITNVEYREKIYVLRMDLQKNETHCGPKLLSMNCSSVL